MSNPLVVSFLLCLSSMTAVRAYGFWGGVIAIGWSMAVSVASFYLHRGAGI